MLIRIKAALVLAAMATGLAFNAAAQDYPSRPIRVIVPFPPGGSTDILARTVFQQLGKEWRQSIIIDNRPGASGMIGTEMAARAAPDGYTLLMGSGGPLTISPSLYDKLAYDPVKDFVPVTVIATVPNIIVANTALPAHSVKELIALAKSEPGKLAFASTGNASPGQLAGEMFKAMTGTDMLHVPYKGSAPSVSAVLGGEVALNFTTTPPVVQLVKSGKLRALAVTSSVRVPDLPDVPTAAESGLPGYEAISWFGVVAPRGTPEAIVQKLHADLVRTINSPGVRKQIQETGSIPLANTPEQMEKMILDDTAKWAKVVKESHIRPN
ncbi:Bug family tripartite tricarboxylate transporter substrate binding protein [Bordetella flabilis]|uniref:LacI family transcriptional regulator n=1 Tax=Bordetella flabilis TaxID=463014 RepID=A0A193GEU5_9BORD|nr:tripartite tricarboxylate transporter substrate binding protein [Bordetella flabilis]ANN77971.1 LacI family transcriptional regulator [Bordetella flabilis]